MAFVFYKKSESLAALAREGRRLNWHPSSHLRYLGILWAVWFVVEEETLHGSIVPCLMVSIHGRQPCFIANSTLPRSKGIEVELDWVYISRKPDLPRRQHKASPKPQLPL